MPAVRGAGTLVAASMVLAGACSGARTTPVGSASKVPAPVSALPSTTTLPALPATAAATQPPATTTPVPATTVPAAIAVSSGTASPVSAADIASTYRAGCPVGPAQLRLLRMSYWGFDGQPHVGTMVVHEAVTAMVLKVFATLYGQRFPIRTMQPEDAYGGSDPASMAADNTSGFNCRYAVAPGTPQWSVHAYGEAIDVDPVENPYLEGGTVQPPDGGAYLNRSLVRPGMAVPGGQLVAAFASVGWSWGGRWPASPDYQHFSLTGG